MTIHMLYKNSIISFIDAISYNLTSSIAVVTVADAEHRFSNNGQILYLGPNKEIAKTLRDINNPPKIVELKSIQVR